MSLTERHVRARIEKRKTRCTSWPKKVAVQFAPCPGWAIADRDTAPKVRACRACNELAPARLRVDDKQALLLPEAIRALSDAKIAIERRKLENRYTRHWQEPTPNGVRIACGAKLGNTPGGRRAHVFSTVIGYVNCEECRRIFGLTPQQRADERAARSEALRVKFAGKNAERATARDKIRQAARDAVELARPDALVCLDALEEVGALGLSVQAWPLTDHTRPTHSRFADALFRLSAERYEYLNRTIEATMVAYRLDNPRSRGERLWISQVKTHGWPNEHLRTADKINVQCRYCRELLLEDKRQGFDYTFETNPHTVPCALRYLAGDLLLKSKETA